MGDELSGDEWHHTYYLDTPFPPASDIELPYEYWMDDVEFDEREKVKHPNMVIRWNQYQMDGACDGCGEPYDIGYFRCMDDARLAFKMIENRHPADARKICAEIKKMRDQKDTRLINHILSSALGDR